MVVVIALLALSCSWTQAEGAGSDGYTIQTGISYREQWGPSVSNIIMKDGEIVKILCDPV